MSDIVLSIPVDPANSVITQTYNDHVAVAKKYGKCYFPGMKSCSGYYYGGIDYGYIYDKTPPVYAAAAGVVDRIYDDPGGYGNAVRLRHDTGHYTIYAHLSAISVKVGERVKSGQVIGRGGSTGYSSGPHLHFEFRDERGYPIDPAPYLQGSKPVVTPPAPPAPEEKPILFDVPGKFVQPAKVRVTAPAGLNVRMTPASGDNSPILAGLVKGEEVSVLELLQPRQGEVWLRIGRYEYIAAQAGGMTLVEWV